MTRLMFCLVLIAGLCFLPTIARAACCPVDSCYDYSDSVWTDSCCVLSGDVNNDGSVNGIDVVYLQNYFRGSGPAPIPEVQCSGYPSGTYYMSADVNGSCSLNGVDLTYLVNYLSHGGAAPTCCGEASRCKAYYP